MAEPRIEPLFSSLGAQLIAAERQRQIDAEGWTPEHDDEHSRGELCRAGVAYAITYVWQQFGVDDVEAGQPEDALEWPWEPSWYKPGRTALDTLVKAGALIAAEIDRIHRAE